MVKKHAPLMEAAHKVKLEAAMAHLWFEEIISGDRYVDIQVVWQHIDQAQWYAHAMLFGGEDRSGTQITPIETPALRSKANQTIAGIQAFRSIAERRWTEQSASLVGSDIDQLFDQTFEEFLASAEGLVVAQKKAMQQELQRFKQFQGGLIICVGVLGLMVAWLLLRYESRRTDDMQALRESEELLAKTQHMALIGSWSQNCKTNTLKWTREVCRILDIETTNQARANQTTNFETFLKHVHPEDKTDVLNTYRQSFTQRNAYDITFRLKLASGRIKYINLRGQTSHDEQGNALQALGSFQDITEQTQSEDALRRAQKMESIGKLTGGIAHDFNNILAIIIGNVGLLTHSGDSKENIEKRAKAIEKSAQRASALTKQLLGLSRHQSAALAVVNINQLINQTMDLITRSLTPGIEVKLNLSEQLWPTEIDPGEFQDTLLNLIINAQDAMAGRGLLTLETTNEQQKCQTVETEPGRFVRLRVSDTGEGIPLDLQERLFEPFFTTKAPGEGTGLGLSMVYNFVKRSGGHITVESEEGQGAAFNLFLPFSEKACAGTPDKPPSDPPRGSETILAVDDEAGLLEVAKATLEDLGYQVFTASNGKQALETLTKHSHIDLLFSDVVMAGGINGYELAEQATLLNPGIQVLLTSGYTEQALARNSLEVFRSNVLAKPYSRMDLALRVRQTLA